MERIRELVDAANHGRLPGGALTCGFFPEHRPRAGSRTLLKPSLSQ
jgi:hypothetical protein